MHLPRLRPQATNSDKADRPSRLLWRGCSRAFLAALAVIAGTNGLQNAVANGDTRSLSFYHTHTKESATITFRRNGTYDSAALEKLNWLLRDWRVDEATKMDPRLFDIVWEVHREVGSKEPVHVVSAYRSPKTNAMLRSRSRGVAQQSQHMVGKAMDFYLPDADMGQVRAIGMRLQRGGVGYYPSSFNPFVHLDAGSVRSWPRMPRAQLARLFPDGKTVHLPADGTPLPGYELAKADILSRGGVVSGYAATGGDEPATTGSGRSFWAALFGGADEEEDREVTRPARGRAGGTQVAALSPSPAYENANGMAAGSFVSPQPSPDTITAAARRPAPRAPEPAKPAEPQVDTILAAASPVPLPAARPASLIPTVEERVQLAAAQADTPSGMLAALPLPPRRPDTPATTASLASAAAAPAPLSGIEGLILRGTTDISAPGSALGFAAVAHPLPPVRPAAEAGIRVASVGSPVMASAASEPAPRLFVQAPPARPVQQQQRDREGLRQLFASADTVRANTAPAVEIAKPRQNAAVQVRLPSAPPVVTSFMGSVSQVEGNRFTGPAVQPMKLANFARR